MFYFFFLSPLVKEIVFPVRNIFSQGGHYGACAIIMAAFAEIQIRWHWCVLIQTLIIRPAGRRARSPLYIAHNCHVYLDMKRDEKKKGLEGKKSFYRKKTVLKVLGK